MGWFPCTRVMLFPKGHLCSTWCQFGVRPPLVFRIAQPRIVGLGGLQTGEPTCGGCLVLSAGRTREFWVVKKRETNRKATIRSVVALFSP